MKDSPKYDEYGPFWCGDRADNPPRWTPTGRIRHGGELHEDTTGSFLRQVSVLPAWSGDDVHVLTPEDLLQTYRATVARRRVQEEVGALPEIDYVAIELLLIKRILLEQCGYSEADLSATVEE